MNYLELLRKQRGETQKQLAEKLGIDAITMNRIERGWYARPPKGLEIRLAEVFGPGWTFAKLMEQVPLVQVAAPDASV